MTFDNLRQDLRVSLRGLRRAPAFVAAALATLALGVGASTAVFSVLRSVLLRPLAFPDSGRLVRVFESDQTLGGGMSVAYPNFLDWTAGTRAFSSLAAYRPAGVALTGVGEARHLDALASSWRFLETLGLGVQRGRFFGAAEDTAGGPAVVVISQALWRDVLGADPAVLERSLAIDGDSYSIIGVLPPGFELPGLAVDAILPLARQSHADRNAHQLQVVGRLGRSATLAQAREELTAIAHRLGETYPATNAGLSVTLADWREVVVGDIRPTLRVLAVAVGFIMLIAAANLGNLLLARGLARAPDVAVRSALGASRGRLLGIALGESLLLAIAGCGLGVGLGWALVRGLVTLRPPGLARIGEVGLDGSALGLAIAVTLGAAALAALVPAWLGSRPDLGRSLQSAARGAGEAGSRRLRQALVAGEVGTAIALLLGTGLALRSLAALQEVDSGFAARGVLTAHLALPPARVALGQVAPFYDRLTARLAALPGVEAAGTIDFLPFSGYRSQTPYRLEGEPEPLPGQESWADVAVVGGEYFATLRIALLRGRLFDAGDRADAVPRILVDRRFVERRLPKQDPLGRRVIVGGLAREIVGVVEHVRNYGLDSDPRPQVYLAARQVPAAYTHVVVRGKASAPPRASALRATVKALDPDLPVDDVRTMASRVAGSLARRRFSLLLLGAFAAVALVLAAVGIFGVLSYSVARRAREVGVRRALGADRRSIVRLFVGEGLRLGALGAAAGVVLAIPMLRAMRSLLFTVGGTDPLAWLGALAVVTVVVLLAAALPARRAAAMEPAQALRSE